ncbi:hypothetical protein SBV1_1390015 [Verrucomicrobia bacterium]|nr:hypothetical protein SBV1_1390015 [Verrucomicrobiota bacterium]
MAKEARRQAAAGDRDAGGGAFCRARNRIGAGEPQRRRKFHLRFSHTSSTNAQFENFSAQNGRIRFILKENPERKILHTTQVERNGFIHAVVCGTAWEDQGYEYFGPRAYSRWIGLNEAVPGGRAEGKRGP